MTKPSIPDNVVPLFGGDRKPRDSWEEIREWLGSPVYPENPPPGIAWEMAVMKATEEARMGRRS